MDNEEMGQRNYYSPLSTLVEEQYDISKPKYEYPNIETKPEQSIEIETDDYSLNSNYTEQTNYDIKTVQPFSEQTMSEQAIFRPLEIHRQEQKQEEQVSLIKSRQKIHLGGRMKIVMSSFVVIMLTLLFATCWNFYAMARPNSMLAEKENTIAELQSSISSLTEEYKLLDSEEYLKQQASEAGFVDVTDANSKTINLDDMYSEPTVTDIPSNWFNDVCNFIQHIFN